MNYLPVDYLKYLIQWKCYVDSCRQTADSRFGFWNFMEFFFPLNILGLWLVDSADVEPEDMEGQLYVLSDQLLSNPPNICILESL